MVKSDVPAFYQCDAEDYIREYGEFFCGEVLLRGKI
jgi:hypothetical protein